MTIRELLDATPEPPSGDVDIDVLLATFHEVLAARQHLIDSARDCVLVAEDRSLISELEARQAAWSAALARARAVVAQGRVNAGKLRGYASVQAGEL